MGVQMCSHEFQRPYTPVYVAVAHVYVVGIAQKLIHKTDRFEVDACLLHNLCLVVNRRKVGRGGHKEDVGKGKLNLDPYIL